MSSSRSSKLGGRARAAILVEQRRPLEVAELELPKTLACGQVLVKIQTSGICGAQLNEIEGAKGPDEHLPHLLGHEGFGTVVEAGPGVTRVKAGDRVILHWRKASGIQSQTPTYRWGSKTVNAGWVTTFNESAVVSENRLTPVPPGLDPKLAPLFGCAITTAMGVINNDAQLKIGQSVVVFGLGGVGIPIVQAARLASACPIIGVDLHEEKFEMARRFGATHCVNGGSLKDAEAEIRRIAGARGPDVVIETTGSSRVIEAAYRMTHPDGRTILVGVPDKKDPVSIYTLPIHFNQVLKGSHGGDSVPDVEIPRYLRLLDAGVLKLDGLVTHEFPLERINEAVDTLRSGRSGRIVIRMGEGG